MKNSMNEKNHDINYEHLYLHIKVFSNLVTCIVKTIYKSFACHQKNYTF